jgi:hypothetical protein
MSPLPEADPRIPIRGDVLYEVMARENERLRAALEAVPSREAAWAVPLASLFEACRAGLKAWDHHYVDEYLWFPIEQALAAVDEAIKTHDGSTPEHPRLDGSYGWPQPSEVPA